MRSGGRPPAPCHARPDPRPSSRRAQAPGPGGSRGAGGVSPSPPRWEPPTPNAGPAPHGPPGREGMAERWWGSGGGWRGPGAGGGCVALPGGRGGSTGVLGRSGGACGGGGSPPGGERVVLPPCRGTAWARGASQLEMLTPAPPHPRAPISPPQPPHSPIHPLEPPHRCPCKHLPPPRLPQAQSPPASPFPAGAPTGPRSCGPGLALLMQGGQLLPRPPGSAVSSPWPGSPWHGAGAALDAPWVPTRGLQLRPGPRPPEKR